MLQPRTLIAVLLLASVIAGCGDAESPEQRVRAVVEAMETAVEARDTGDVLELLSPQYRDAYGNTPEEISRYIRGYFVANQSIHLLTRIEEISFPSEDEARASVVVGMLGRESAENDSWDLAADLYRFEIALLLEDDEWKVSWAEWERG